MTDKIREIRLRRMAKRQGMLLVKSRRRDKLALDYGEYWLVNRHGEKVFHAYKSAAAPFSDELTTLDKVEAYLKGERQT